MKTDGRYAYYRHGITPEERQALFDYQNGKCAVCFGPLTGTTEHDYIDHDHETGYVRGLLCKRCNPSLGWYENNQTAINDYLINPPAAQIGITVRKGEPTIADARIKWSTEPPPSRPKRTHCKNGHEFTEENTSILRNGERRCRQCSRDGMRRRMDRDNPNRKRLGYRKP